jgi:hypothetical protein
MIFPKSGPEVDWANELAELSWAYRQARLLQVASVTGLFARLARGRATTEDVAMDLHLVEPMVEKILIALAAMGLAVRDDGAWKLTPRAAATLSPEAPLYQGHTLAHAGQVWRFWNDLEPALRGEKGGWIYTPLGEPTPRSHGDFILAMHNMAMAGRAAAMADLVDLRGRRKLMDVGGGPGTYSMALCERNPDLHATVFDLPETIQIAREVIARLGMVGRVATIAGDWDKDEFGEGNDVVLLSNVMHGTAGGAEMKLAKARRSLAAGGLLLVQEFLLNAEKTGPLIPALFNIMVGAFSEPELKGRITAAGFADLKVMPMPANAGTTLITAMKTDE